MRNIKFNPKKTSPIKKETMDMVKSVAVGKKPGKFDSVVVGKKAVTTPKTLTPVQIKKIKEGVKSVAPTYAIEMQPFKSKKSSSPAVSQKAKDFMKGTTGPKKITPPSKRQAGGVKFKK